MDEHPDGRAVMFEALKYNRRKINDLLMALSGFERVLQLKKLYGKYRTEGSQLIFFCFKSELIVQICEESSHFFT